MRSMAGLWRRPVDPEESGQQDWGVTRCAKPARTVDHMKSSPNFLLGLVSVLSLLGCRYEQQEKPNRFTNAAAQVMVSEGMCSSTNDCVQRGLIRTKSSTAITKSSDWAANAVILDIYEAPSREIGQKITNTIGPILFDESRCVVVRVHLKSGDKNMRENSTCPTTAVKPP